MRLLIHGINYAPEIVGIGKYSSELAEWMALRGHTVCVHTARPYYPQWRVPEDYCESRDHEQLNGVAVNRHAIYVPADPGGVSRLLHHASWLRNSWPGMLRDAKSFKPDIVLAIAPSLMGAPAALRVASRHRIPSVLHVQDFEVGAAHAAKLLASGSLLRVAGAVERALIHRFNYVTTISAAMDSRLHLMGLSKDRTTIVRNWADIDTITPQPPGQSDLRKALGLEPGKIVLLYAGSISRKQGLDVVLKAARVLQHRSDLKFLVFGEGPTKEHYQSQARDLPNVVFGPFQPREKLNDLLATADIHLLPQIAGAADLVLPSKLTGMLASGRPVIATTPARSGLAAEVTNVGRVVPPADPQPLVRAIIELADNPDVRRQLGVSARKRAEAVWGKNMILKRFEERLESWIRSHSRQLPFPYAQTPSQDSRKHLDGL